MVPNLTKATLDYKAPAASRWINLKDLTSDQKRVMTNFRKLGFKDAIISYLTFTPEYREQYAPSLNYCMLKFSNFFGSTVRLHTTRDLLQCPDIPDSVKVTLIRMQSYTDVVGHMRDVRFKNTEKSFHLLCDVAIGRMVKAAISNMDLLLADIAQQYQRTAIYDSYKGPRNYQGPNQIRFWVELYLLNPKTSSKYLDIFPWRLFNNDRPKASNTHDMLTILNAVLPFNPSAIKIFKNISVLNDMWEERYGLDAVKKSGSAIAHIPPGRRTQAICDAAVRSTPSALKYVPRDKYNKGIIMEQALQSDTVLKYAR